MPKNTTSFPTSAKMFDEARTLMPGGVNSPVRAFGSVGGNPLFFKRAKGSRMWDVDNNEFIDYVGSWGPAILGHGHPEVINAVTDAVNQGFSFGAPTEAESILAKMIIERVPAAEMVRLVSSGTEACMSALRLARGYTKRDKIIKFNGCYHGHADMLLVKAGSGVATLGIPGSPGVPEGATAHTLVAPYNDLDAVEELLKSNAGEVACIILEPFVGNAGFIRPKPGFLTGLRQLCDQNGALLIFDEVMTGFRVGPAGAYGLANVTPDLLTFGKVVGGGMPIGAYGGKKEIMEQVAPAGPIYQAGTLSGNPVAMACGIQTLAILAQLDYVSLYNSTRKLMDGFESAASSAGINLVTDCEGGMFGFSFRSEPIENFEDASSADMDRFNRFFSGMLNRGIYLAPSAFEAGFMSFSHSEEDINQTLEAARETFEEL
ncbi:MAG: glutamate-1-semialdehyde-2,1-aminomutase [Zetaproteobacteria bacterium]|nr:glutamate-1-semialdehyde-2,1-aminomutase [Pseudobdellovibrionaceae bacterium]|tara:strand:+ start:427 stop:1722 length:1296 start_codon:yes stop_codon:yes gene_type:complete